MHVGKDVKCSSRCIVRLMWHSNRQGFCFIKYEDQRSTILAVDNFNGIQLLGRTIRVDHKHQYSLPKEVISKTPSGILSSSCPLLTFDTSRVKTPHSHHQNMFHSDGFGQLGS